MPRPPKVTITEAVKPSDEDRGRVLPKPPTNLPLPTPDDRVPPKTLGELEMEQQRLAASSPLAMRFEVVGCEYAHMTWQPDKAIPDYQFNCPCPFGKSIPDQDCRDCSHVLIHPIGQEQHVAQHRYHHWGVVVPLTEEQADTVMEAAVEAGAEPLRRPLWIAHFDQLREKEEQRERERQHAERIAAQQRGPTRRPGT